VRVAFWLAKKKNADPDHGFVELRIHGRAGRGNVNRESPNMHDEDRDGNHGDDAREAKCGARTI
jgi:hypothetical protein